MKVKKKIKFPLTEIDPGFAAYIEPQEIIDITPGIRELALELSQEEDDLYRVVFNLADWVHENIEYNLSSATAEATQKSSWTLSQRYGVCDEITALFISLNRALGIPARFVSGSAYTDLNNDWGSHGWAEVYFPGVGWVPFDVTYAQFGYVDASHVKFVDSADATPSSVSYISRGIDFDIKPGELKTDVQVKEFGIKKQGFIDVDVEMLYD